MVYPLCRQLIRRYTHQYLKNKHIIIIIIILIYNNQSVDFDYLKYFENFKNALLLTCAITCQWMPLVTRRASFVECILSGFLPDANIRSYGVLASSTGTHIALQTLIHVWLMDQRKVTITCENRTHDRRNKQRSELNKNQSRRIIKKRYKLDRNSRKRDTRQT